MHATLRVIGVPRSGTNLVKYLVESASDVRCMFNHGWWKHAVVPPVFAGNGPAIDNVPTLVMFREPVEQVIAFLRFSAKGRSGVYGDHASPQVFIRSPIFTDPPGGYSFRFDSPASYWMQFYWAALHWDKPDVLFLSLEAAQRDAAVVKAAVQSLCPLGAWAREPSPPRDYLGRNGDVHTLEISPFEPGISLEAERRDSARLRGGLAEDDLAQILRADVVDLYGNLQKREFAG